MRVQINTFTRNWEVKISFNTMDKPFIQEESRGNLFRNVWVYVCVLYCVGVLVICVLVFTVFCIVCTVLFYCVFYVYFILTCFVCTSVRTAATG
jgi:hypothetical protein